MKNRTLQKIKRKMHFIEEVCIETSQHKTYITKSCIYKYHLYYMFKEVTLLFVKPQSIL